MSLNTGEGTIKLEAIRCQYDSMSAQERQELDLAMLDLETGIGKRAEANDNQAWFGPVSAIELLYELARFLNSE